MEDSKKKKTMIIIVVACIALAGVITFMTQSGRDSGLKALEGQIQWVKCANPDCSAAYEMDKKEFHEYLRDHINPANPMATPPLPCKECGKESIYKAVKCEKCGDIFFDGTVGANDYSDRCPKCGHSNNEELRKQAERK